MKKNAYLTLFVLLLSLSVNFVSAQSDYNGFNLKDYYTPDIVRNALVLNTSLSGNVWNTNDTATSLDINLNNAYISFSRVINTRKNITNISAYFYADFNYNKSTDKTYQFNLYNSESFFYNNQIYYKPKYFFGYGASLAHFGTFDKSSNSNDIKLSNMSVHPSVSWGIGRIEDVTDARQAIYILQDFKKNNVLKREMTKDEIFEFAQLISTVKNKRFLDSRLHRIDEITAVDQFLNDKDILSDTGAAYFTSLYDMWDYGALFNRNSGSQFTIQLSPFFSGYFEKGTVLYPDDINKTYYYGATGSIVYAYNKPVKLNWQHNFSANANFDFYRSTIDGQGSYSEINPFGYVSYALNYYPSTRTNLYASAKYLLSYSKIINYNQYSFYQNASIGGGMNYYVSQNLRLTADIYLSKYFRKNSTNDSYNNLYFYYGFSMAYLFF